MKAVGYRSSGPIDRTDALIEVDLPLPNPDANDLRVRVRAISVNPVDVKVRAHSRPAAGDTKILGWDAAGVVDAVGADVTCYQWTETHSTRSWKRSGYRKCGTWQHSARPITTWAPSRRSLPPKATSP